jgi:hypothetical protein
MPMLETLPDISPELIRIAGVIVFVVFFWGRQRRRRRTARPQTVIPLD